MGKLADESSNVAFLLGGGIGVFLAWIGSTVTGAAAGGLISGVVQYGLDSRVHCRLHHAPRGPLGWTL